MGSQYYTDPIAFVIGTLIDLYLYAIAVRFLCQYVRADFYNPFGQFLIKATDPVLKPLRRIIPGLGGMDLAAVVLLLVIAALKVIVLTLLSFGVFPPLMSIVGQSLATVVNTFLNVLLFAIIIQVILSWVAPQTYNPIVSMLYAITEPLLRPVRNRLPSMGGLDLSPLVMILFIQVSKMLLLPPLYSLSRLAL